LHRCRKLTYESTEDLTVKIDDSLPPVGNMPTHPTARADKPANPASPPAAPPGAERVELSALAAHLQGIDAGAAPVDAARIDELREAIAAGRFPIHPERIAARLLADVRELLSRQH